MTTPYSVSTSIGSVSYDNYVNAPIVGPLSTNQYPSVIPYHSYGTLAGIRPTPPQFLPSQEPVYAEQGLLLCCQSLGGRGITPTGVIFAFSSYQDFVSQNPQWHWVQLPEPRWHGVTIVDDIDLPLQGGYQIEWGGNPTRSADGYTYYPY